MTARTYPLHSAILVQKRVDSVPVQITLPCRLKDPATPVLLTSESSDLTAIGGDAVWRRQGLWLRFRRWIGGAGGVSERARCHGDERLIR
jgi:hypothetical protein